MDLKKIKCGGKAGLVFRKFRRGTVKNPFNIGLYFENYYKENNKNLYHNFQVF